MRRREFITLLGGAAAAWPVVAPAQQADRVFAALVFCGLSPCQISSPRHQSQHFGKGSKRSGEGRPKSTGSIFALPAAIPIPVRPCADELVNLTPSIIIISSNMVTTSVQRRTRTVPIIFIRGGQPVAQPLRE